jgi:SAM-dependent methyltransferase
LAEAIRRLGRNVNAAELGTGTGGGTDAILRGVIAAGEPRLSSLTLTDIAPSLLVNTLERVTQTYPSAPRLARRRLDFSRPFSEQGLAPGSFDVLVGVNALHNAPNLVKMLETLREELPQDGFLVISESICGADTQVHQDFIFNLFPLNHPRREIGSSSTRRHSRFLTSVHWREALEAAGFSAEIHVNRLGPELALLAIARKPS